MTTPVYHVKLSSTEHTALVSLHYVGTTIARAMKYDNATPVQREELFKQWLDYLSQVEPALYKNTTIETTND